jgi:hypothetical protein
VNSQLAIYTALALLAVGSPSRAALADEAPEANAPPAPAPATSAPTEPVNDTPSSDARANVPERGFLFAVEPSVPDPLHAVISAGMGNVTRTGEERPVGSGPVFPTLVAEVGLLPRLSVYAEGGAVVIQSGNPGQLASPFILDAGVHVLLTDPTSRMWQLSLRPSYSYDVTGASTLNLTATLGWYYENIRIVSSFEGSHTFQADADAIDLQATFGATYVATAGLPCGTRRRSVGSRRDRHPGRGGRIICFCGADGWLGKRSPSGGRRARIRHHPGGHLRFVPVSRGGCRPPLAVRTPLPAERDAVSASVADDL